jgi:hypothetical protein
MRKSGVVVVAMFLAVVLAAGCSRGPSDTEVANEVKARMFSSGELGDSRIEVAAKAGEVTLTGEAASEADRFLAYKLATETPGVKKVNDQMTVRLAETKPAEPEPAPERPAPRRVTPPRTQTQAAPAAAVPAPAVAQPVASTSAAPAIAEPQTPPAPRTRTVTLPAGTRLQISMIDSIDSEKDRAGQEFRASLDAPIVIGEDVVVPAGQDVFIKLIDARSAGRMTGRSELRVEAVRLVYQGRTYTIDTTEYEEVGGSRGKRTAATIGGGAAIGAAIGAAAGGGKGAAIGAAIGAGSGTAVQVLTKGEQVRIPSETRLDFRLEQPVEITYTPGRAQSN